MMQQKINAVVLDDGETWTEIGNSYVVLGVELDEFDDLDYDTGEMIRIADMLEFYLRNHPQYRLPKI